MTEVLRKCQNVKIIFVFKTIKSTNIMKVKYLKPDIDSIGIMQENIICTSPGIDPEGSGHDFNWGDDTGVVPGGNGDDFNWGN